jgi:polysaccharide biosynthesis protein PelG
VRDLQADESPAPRGAIREAFREYRLLAGSAMLVYAAIWIDKLLTWFGDGASSARMLANASALAWFTVIPAFAWIYLQVETSFYRVFRGYYGGIESGAALDELEASARGIKAEVTRLVRGALAIQLVVLVVAQLAAPRVAAELVLGSGATVAIRWALVAASLQVMTLLGLLLLYYLDLRREAFLVAVAQFGTVVAATLLVLFARGVPAMGAALGSLPPAILAIWTVRRVVTTLVPTTFQSQPYGDAL